MNAAPELTIVQRQQITECAPTPTAVSAAVVQQDTQDVDGWAICVRTSMNVLQHHRALEAAQELQQQPAQTPLDHTPAVVELDMHWQRMDEIVWTLMSVLQTMADVE